MALTTQKFATKHKIVNALPPVDCNGGKTTDVISLKNYDTCTFIVQFGVVNDSATPGLLTIKKCTAVDATGAAAMAFTYRVEATAAGDTLDAAAAATSTGIDLDSVLSTTDSVFVVIEVKADELTDGTTTAYDCLRLDIAYSAHSAIASCVAILSDGSYLSDTLPTAITD